VGIVNESSPNQEVCHEVKKLHAHLEHVVSVACAIRYQVEAVVGMMIQPTLPTSPEKGGMVKCEPSGLVEKMHNNLEDIENHLSIIREEISRL